MPSGKLKMMKLSREEFIKTLWQGCGEHGLEKAHQVMRVLNDGYDCHFSLTRNHKGKAIDIIPVLKDNPVWHMLVPALINVTMKGVGIGEMFMTLIHPQSEYRSDKDLVIDGKNIECKKDAGGCIKGNKKNERFIDDIRKKYDLPKKTEDFYLELSKKSQEEKAQFWREVYKDISEVHLSLLIDLPADVDKAKKQHGMIILQRYVKIDGIDSLFLISESGDYVFIDDFDDADFINKNCKFTPKIYRGKDTNAVGDGYAVIKARN